MLRSPTLRRLIPYFILFVEVMAFHRLVLFSDYAIPWDLRSFHRPHSYVYAEALKHGELPLWDPYTYCGRPLQANVQAEVFYPTVALSAWIASVTDVDKVGRLLELNVILHVLLAGIFAYWLGLAMGLSVPGALLLGTVYQLGSFFATHVEHMGAVTISAWCAFALFAIVRLFEAPGWRWGLVLTAAFAMCVLGGLTPLTAVAFAVVLVFAALWGWSSGRLRPMWIVAAAMAASLAMSAVQLLPTVQLNENSIGRFRAEFLLTGGGVPLQALVSMVWPNYYGIFHIATYKQPFEPTFMYLYMGALPLLFTLFVFVRPKNRIGIVLVAMTVLTGFAMLGDSTALFRWIYSLLPAQVRAGIHPEFTMPVFNLCASMAAAFGFDRLVRRPRLKWAVVAVTAVDLIAVSAGHDMSAMSLKAEPDTTRTAFDGNRETLARVHRLVNSSAPPWRIDNTIDAMPWAMSGEVTEIPAASGYDPLALSRYMAARLALADGKRWGASYEPQHLESPVLGMLNVRYIISRAPLEPEKLAGTPVVFRENLPGFNLYENQKALPRFWLVKRVLTAASEAHASEMLKSRTFSPEQEAIVEGNPTLGPDAPLGTVAVRSYGLNQIELEVTAPATQYLATSEVHYPGWKAWVDGVEQPIYYTNVGFRGLVVPAGMHRITLRFRPAILYWSGAVSALAWLVWLWLWITKAARATSPSASSASESMRLPASCEPACDGAAKG